MFKRDAKMKYFECSSGEKILKWSDISIIPSLLPDVKLSLVFCLPSPFTTLKINVPHGKATYFLLYFLSFLIGLNSVPFSPL